MFFLNNFIGVNFEAGNETREKISSDFAAFVHTAKLKKSNFLNDFFLSLTTFARVTSFLTRFSKSF